MSTWQGTTAVASRSLSVRGRIGFNTDSPLGHGQMSGTTTRGDDKPLNADRSVTIDRSRTAVRYRWVCPNGHVDWDRTNDHTWCRGCKRAADRGEDLDPEHHAVWDKKRDELVPYENITLSGGR